METEANKTTKMMLNDKKTARAIIIPNFKLYYKIILIKTTQNYHKTDPLNNGIKLRTHTNSHSYSHFSFEKEDNSTC